MMTFDAVSQFTIDSTGAFLEGELERLDQTLHEPLVAVTWGRDIDLREDVTLADADSSFTLSSYAAPGGISPTSKRWISTRANAISGIQLDIGKVVNPLLPWGVELEYSVFELASAAKLGRPVDQQKYAGMKLAWQMDVDSMVYTGDTVYNKTGLFNSTLVTPSNVALGGAGVTTWINASGQLTKTPDEMLQDVNSQLEATWASAAFAVIPTELRLPPVHFNVLVSNKVSSAGNVSILEFLKMNSLTMAQYGRPLNIQPVKWLTGLGVGSTNRMVAYTKDRERVRFPLVPLQRTPLQYRSIFQVASYYGKLGCVEVVYPETISYRDGI
jgi:hypothetical protein